MSTTRNAVLLACALLPLMACTPMDNADDATDEAVAAAPEAPADSAAPPMSAPLPPEPVSPTPPADMADACDADAAQRFVGQAATAEVVEQARIAAGATMVRTIKPGQPVTMDYRAERLNLEVDAGNVIATARCG